MKTLEQLIAEAERQREEIAQYFRDVEYWNQARDTNEGEIDPDPTGEMMGIAAALTKFISAAKQRLAEG